MDYLHDVLNHWDTIGLILTNILAIFVPSPRQRKK